TAALPRAGRALVGEHDLVQARAVGAPVVAADLEGGLRAVVDAVEEEARAPARQVFVANDVGRPAKDGGAAVLGLAAQFQRQYRGARAGDGDARIGHVAKRAGAVLAALDEIDRVGDRLGGHVAAEVLGRPQGHDLPAGDADVAAVVGLDTVAPAALVRHLL